MQVTRFKESFLRQGTIISLRSIAFENRNKSKMISFNNLFPEVNLKGINYGIILTQTCDLVREGNRKVKAPFIAMALLEPIERYIEDKYYEDLKLILERNFLDFEIKGHTRKFVNKEKVLRSIGKDLGRIFQNNEKYYFFITMTQWNNLRLFTVNLSKVFSLRNSQYDILFSKAKYQLKLPFENKLGWKLAEMYGRIGTPDYKEADINKLSIKIFEKLNKKLGAIDAFYLKNDEFIRAKKLENAREEKKEEFFIDLITRISN